MSSDTSGGTPRGPIAEDPLAAPLFGATREATPEEMALIEAEEAEEGMEEAAAAQADSVTPADAGLTASEQPAPAAEVAPPSPEPTPAPADPPDNVVRLGAKPVLDATRGAMEDFPALVLSVFMERNAKTTGESYAGHLRRFLTWCAARGVDLASMPANTAQTYLEEAYPNPVSRNQAIVALRSSFDIGAIRGVTFAPQELVKTIRPPKKERTATQAQAMPLTPPRAAMAPRGEPLAAEPAAPVRESAVRSVPTEQVSTVRATPTSLTPKKGTSAVPSLGGRIRISKRVDGSEGLPGVPVGSLVLIGDYSGHDLDGEGRIESFIANFVRPQYGPHFGQRPCVYYVDRLDNLGNPIPGSTLNVPIMSSPAAEQNPGNRPAPQVLNGAGAVATGPQAAAASSVTGDRFFDYLIMEQKRREEDANKRIAEIKENATKQGMDPTMLMLLLDRAKPEPLDPQKVIAEAKRQGFLKPPREERPEPPPPPPMPPGGLGGLDAMFGGPPPSPPPDAGMEALTVVLKQQGEMIQALLTRAMTPPPAAPQAPAMDLAGIIALAKSLAPAPAPESALQGQVMQALITRALAPPEKPKSIAETLKEIAALNEAKELLGGGPEEKPLSFAEVVTAAIENAPAIGQAVATVLGSMPRAPTLPQPGGPARRASDPQAPGQPPPQRSAAAPMPPEAQQAFLALKVATDEQEIVNHIFTILTAYVQSGAEPWPRAANKLVDDFKKCDTKPEIRAVVTNLFVWSGAKRLMSEPAVERISTVLHAHYSMIYGQLAPGEEKTLKDADSAGEQAAAEAADAAAAAGNAPVYEEQAPGDTVGNVVVQ